MAFITVTGSGNCNFAYITGLQAHLKAPEVAMAEVLTARTDYYGYQKPKDAKPEYKTPAGGMFLFAQGSEDSVRTKPYAPQFKKFIEESSLGIVHELPPVKNPLHNNKVGILFVWIIDHEACRVWWHTNVLAKWEAAQAVSKDKDKIKKEVK